MTPVGQRFSLVKEYLQRDLALLVRELVPGAHRAGNVWSARNPTRADRKAGSFVVWAAPVAGAWKDYATGEAGDVVDLVAYLKALTRWQVLEWGEDRYGIRRLPPAKRKEMTSSIAVRRAAEDKATAAAELRKREWALALFEGAVSRLRGTLVETYAEARGTPLREIPSLEHQWFRFHPDLEWWMGATRDPETNRKIAPGPRFPALVSAMVDAHGNARAIHCTFLAPDGRGKAPVAKPKLMFPATSGLVIRVSRGRDRLTPEAAARNGVLTDAFVGEGVEDGWTMAHAMPELRCLAAGSLSGLLNMPDMACVEGWLVGRDNDWGKDQAADLFERAMARIRGFGKPAEEISATGGAKDFNDMVKG